MIEIRSRIIKGAKDAKGITRKFIQVPEVYYNDFEFGEVVEIRKLHNKKEIRVPSPDPNDPKPNHIELD